MAEDTFFLSALSLSIKEANLSNTSPNAPAISPALTRLIYTGEKTSGCLDNALDSEYPAFISFVICSIVLVSFSLSPPIISASRLLTIDIPELKRTANCLCSSPGF